MNLDDFKKFSVEKQSKSITGGIACSRVAEIFEIVGRDNPDQVEHLNEVFGVNGIGVQCTKG